MRLTLNKLHRGFKPLDGMTDAQGELWLQCVRRGQPRGARAVAALGVVIVPAVWAGLGALVAGALEWLRGRGVGHGGGPGRVGAAMAVALAGPAAALAVRDLWLGWAIRRQMARARCGGCGRSLLGEPLTSRGVRCPCGREASLAELGISPLDLRPSAEPAACARCGYDLAGLPRQEDMRRCPECGERNGATAHRL